MAKKSEQDGGTAVADAPVVTSKYLVRLTCPTPLRDKERAFDAVSEADAKQQFLDWNGISASEGTWSIELVP